MVVRLADHHVARRRPREQVAPSAQRRIARLRAVEMAGYRPHGTRQPVRVIERLDPRRQHDGIVTHRAQHVVHCTRIALREPRGE